MRLIETRSNIYSSFAIVIDCSYVFVSLPGCIFVCLKYYCYIAVCYSISFNIKKKKNSEMTNGKKERSCVLNQAIFWILCRKQARPSQISSLMRLQIYKGIKLHIDKRIFFLTLEWYLVTLMALDSYHKTLHL